MIVFGAIFVHTLTAFITDIRTRRIPNSWNLIVGVCGVGYHVAVGGWNGFGFALTGVIVLLIITSLLYAIRAIGGGDVKWFASLGAWSGWSFSLSTFIYTFLLAGVFAVLLFLLKGQVLKRIRGFLEWAVFVFVHRKINLSVLKGKQMTEMPLMVAALPAVVIVMWQRMGGWTV